MTIYTRDHFTVQGIVNLYPELIERGYNLEYTIAKKEDKINTIKKEHFQDLFVFETLRATDNTIKPSITVLSQTKALENDDVYKAIIREINLLKKELNSITREYLSLLNQRNKNFTFTTVNFKKYQKLAYEFYLTKTQDSLNNVLSEITNNELGNRIAYASIRYYQLYDIYDLIIEKSPDDQKEFFTNFFSMIKVFDENILNTYIFEDAPGIKDDPIGFACYLENYILNKEI